MHEAVNAALELEGIQTVLDRHDVLRGNQKLSHLGVYKGTCYLYTAAAFTIETLDRIYFSNRFQPEL